MVPGEMPKNCTTSIPQKKLVPVTISLLVLILASASIWQAYAPVGPFIISEFGLSKAQFGIVGMMASMGGLFSSAILGLLIDRITTKRGIILVFGLQFLICSAIYFTRSFRGLLVLLFVHGAVYIAMPSLTNRIIYRIIPPGYRVTAIGIKQSMIPAGSAVTAMFLPIIAMRGNWRNVYILLGLFLLVITILSYTVYHEGNSPNTAKAAEKVPRPEKRRKILTLALAATMFIGMSFTISMSSMISFLIPFSHEYLGMPVLLASSFLATLQFGGAFFRVVFGFFSDKFFIGRRKLELAILMFGNSLLFFVMSRVSPGINVIVFYVLCLLLGISTMAWYSAYFGLAIDQMGEERAGFASGLASTFTMVGTTSGPLVFGFLTDSFGAFSSSFVAISLWLLMAAVIFTLVPIKESH